MKVWVIGRSFPNKSNGNIGSFEYEQAKMLARGGCEVTYLALVFHPFKKINNWGYSTWEDDNITVCTYSQFYAPERLYLHLKNFQTGKWRNFLNQVEKQCGLPDVIHVHYPAMLTEANVILDYQARGVKIVATEHWTKVLNGELKKHHVENLNHYVNQANAFICVGDPLRQAVKRITGDNREIKLIPNVVSEVFFESKQEEQKEYFEFIAVGRLVPVKQFDKMIDAFYQAFGNQNQNVRLTIVGGGAEEKTLRKLISQYGLEKNVSLTGTLPREQTAQRVAQANALLCFSRLETFGVPVIEAWACGKPVIATDSLGFLEYWNEGLGEIVPSSDAVAFGEAMKRMVEKKDDFDATNISEFARANFGEEKIFSMLMECYENHEAQ